MVRRKGKWRRKNWRIIPSFAIKHLYHGTAFEFDKVDPFINKGNPLDFGRGFYTTEDEEYARKYARQSASDIEMNHGYLRIYDYDEDLAKELLDVKEFEEADLDWLSHLLDCRIPPYADPPYDITIGPSADGGLQSDIEAYRRKGLARRIDSEMLIDRLRPDMYPEQFVFHTERSVQEPILTLRQIIDVDVDSRKGKRLLHRMVLRSPRHHHRRDRGTVRQMRSQ